ncbi:hypothetical protein ACMD2_00080 [Ananas comosus]|uniref:Uncharacterized protein n=1 Tax=Ananas comosus TaxID=4615 RepID=A0A199VQD3_ANACO|nr:hypothetical protein ACMD2_00080 [Ananas comosus]
MDGTNGEDLAVGCFLSLRTTLGDEVEGQIITFDRLSNILVITRGRFERGVPAQCAAHQGQLHQGFHGSRARRRPARSQEVLRRSRRDPGEGGGGAETSRD